MDTPVLLLTFNRTNTLKHVLDALRAQQPKYLFVGNDGPRPHKPEDAGKVAAVRQLIAQEVDWPCELHTLYRDENLGCKGAVGGAITWFLEEAGAGMILEDDCVPTPSYFPFVRSCWPTMPRISASTT